MNKNILGTQFIPLNLNLNFTQKQIDEDINLTRSDTIMNDRIQFTMEIQLSP